MEMRDDDRSHHAGLGCRLYRVTLDSLYRGAHSDLRVSKDAGLYGRERAPAPWAEKAKKAHYNAVENLAPFAALVLVAQAAGAANSTTAMASVVYFWARVAHYLFAISAIPYVRTLTFTIGWIAIMVIFYEIVT